MGEYFVFVVQGNKVSQRRIEVGRNFNGNVIVEQGLKPGEQIVVQGHQTLRDGSPILVGSSSNGTAPSAGATKANAGKNNSSKALNGTKK
jgi:membrane fusion protein (multidrug efflux system)